MREISLERKAIQDLVLSSIGISPTRNKAYSGQLASDIHTNEILKYPPRYIFPIQVMNPSSADYGKFYFMAGYSVAGGDDVLGP